MAGQQAQSGLFASLFGQCCKGPPTEGELNFEDDQSGKKKASNSQVPSTPVGASSAASRGLGESRQKSDVATKRYLIDNSVLQIKTHPGVAFRHCKEHSKKVKDSPCVPWGEIVEGSDEGDGWLKVGPYYLPMAHLGQSIITLVEDPNLPARAKQDKAAGDNGMDRKPATPLAKPSRTAQSSNGNGTSSDVGARSDPPPSSAGSAGSATASTSPPKAIVQKEMAKVSPKKSTAADVQQPAVHAAPVVLAAQESACSPKKDVIVEPTKPPAKLAEESVSRQKKDVIAEPTKPPAKLAEEDPSAGAVVDEPKKPVSLAADKDADALVKPEVKPQRGWFLQPSVGTWLQALPQVDVGDAEDLPIHVEPLAVKWQHRPSVGTWVQRRPVGIAAGLAKDLQY